MYILGYKTERLLNSLQQDGVGSSRCEGNGAVQRVIRVIWSLRRTWRTTSRRPAGLRSAELHLEQKQQWGLEPLLQHWDGGGDSPGSTGAVCSGSSSLLGPPERVTVVSSCPWPSRTVRLSSTVWHQSMSDFLWFYTKNLQTARHPPHRAAPPGTPPPTGRRTGSWAGPVSDPKGAPKSDPGPQTTQQSPDLEDQSRKRM